MRLRERVPLYNGRDDQMLITYRQPTPEDEPRLLAIYADSRRDELRAAGWDERTFEAFVRMQFNARETAYRMQFSDLDDRLILADGEVAGRMMVDRSGVSIHLVDIALLESFRGRRIGSAVIGELQNEAAQAGRPVSLRVSITNTSAMPFYERMGFRMARTEGHLSEFEWSGGDGE